MPKGGHGHRYLHESEASSKLSISDGMRRLVDGGGDDIRYACEEKEKRVRSGMAN